jgi:flavin reductase (DIM6/NTAB) family NADH-FMN oxidoreductase RutF
MNKISTGPKNTLCPQTTFLLGTFREDGRPNFGLFCWMTYCWDGQYGMIVSIGEDKLTRDRIRATGIFSANLVNQGILPLADYFGNNSGYDKEKMDIDFKWSRGAVLDVPVLDDSHWSYELEVRHTMKLDGGEVYACAIRNVLADEAALDESTSFDEKMAATKPVLCMPGVYYSVDRQIGSWGDWKDLRVRRKGGV